MDGDKHPSDRGAVVCLFLTPFSHLRYPGEEGGTALANVLFGVTNPSGRMPVTVVESLAQLPEYLDLTMNRPPGRTHRYFTGVPMYPFGFGLSYSTVKYSDLTVVPYQVHSIDTLTIMINITHLSGPDLTDVIQVC